MRLLVTGVSGLLGINLAAQLQGRCEITGVLRGENALAVPGHTPFRVITADLSQVGQVEHVLEQAAPDVVINCAALANIDYCERHPADAWQTNAHMPGWLARAAAERGVQLVHISTDAVFDGLRGAYTEDDPAAPINVYAQTKLAGEQAVAQANPHALIARVNFYGWSWVGTRSLAEWFFYQLAAGKAINGFTDIIFAPLLVNDMIEILMRMIERRLSGLYHVVSPEALSKYAFGQMIARAFGFDERLIVPVTHQQGGLVAPRAPRLDLRPDKLASALGENLPGQVAAAQRFAALQQAGYPQRVKALLAAPLVAAPQAADPSSPAS